MRETDINTLSKDQFSCNLKKGILSSHTMKINLSQLSYNLFILFILSWYIVSTYIDVLPFSIKLSDTKPILVFLYLHFYTLSNTFR